jgi:hypothetical protein
MTTGLRGQPAQLNFNGFTEPVEIVNLTDHEITVWADDALVRLEPSGCVARCNYRRIRVGELRIGKHSVAVTRTVMDGVRDLPPSRPGVYFVVSLMVASVARDRGDLLVPDSPIKDEHGATIAIRSLAMADAADLPVFQRREGAPRGDEDDVERGDEVGAGASGGTLARTTTHGPDGRGHRGQLRAQLPFHSWYAWVAAEVEERTGRPADRITVDWRTLHGKGRTPQEAVDDVLGGDPFEELLADDE